LLDPALLIDNLEILEDNVKKRGLDVDLNVLIQLNEERKKSRFVAEQKRAEQKDLGKLIANSSGDEKQDLLNQASSLSSEVNQLFEIVKQ